MGIEASSPDKALYYFRARFYDPSMGRFVSRDPKGVWGDAANLGNAQSAFANNPVNVRDPFGQDGFSVGNIGIASATAGDVTTITVTARYNVTGLTGDAASYAAAQKKINDAMDEWTKQAPEFANPAGGKIKVEFKADITQDKAAADRKDITVYKDDDAMMDAQKPASIPQKDWDELKKKGKATRATESQFSLDMPLETWLHEVGHSLRCEHEDFDAASVMHRSAKQKTISKRNYLTILWIALAGNAKDAKRRAAIAALAGAQCDETFGNTKGNRSGG
jgi:RHS repeat-associated protein